MASRRIVCLPGDGIGPEVIAEAVRVLEALPLELELSEQPVRRRGDRPDRQPASARDARGLPRAPTRSCSARSAARSGTAARSGPRPGLMGLRKELDVYANLRPAVGEGVDLLIVRELGRRPLLRRPRHARGRHGLRHARVQARAGRADRAARIRARARPRRPAALGRQGERARHLADVAERRHRARARVPGRRAPPRPRRQRRDACS